MRQTRIKIVKTPDGMGIPEEIRKEWVGLEFEARGPQLKFLASVVGLHKGISFGRIYEVPFGVALTALKAKSEEAWNWFMENRLANRIAKNLEKGNLESAEKTRGIAIKAPLLFKAKYCIEIP